MQIIILIVIFIAEFLATPKNLLFYDQPEYLKIVFSNSFLHVLSLGHFPIHPIFLAIFWITSRLTIPNYTALIFGIISGILMYQISKLIFKKGNYWLPLLIFSLFPGVWLVNTNLMIQSILLTFYLLSILFFLKKNVLGFFVTSFLMIGIHIDAVYWIPTVFLLPIFFRNEINFKKKDIIKFIKTFVLSLILSGAFYIFIYVFIRKDFGGSTEQILAYGSFGFLRIVRNIWYSVIYNFGYITPFILLLLLVKNVRSRLEIAAWGFFAICISIGGAYWEGDLMMRRVIFAGVIISFVLYKYLKNKSFLVILYLLPIIIFLAPLYFPNNQNTMLSTMQKHINELPKNQILLQSHYYQPFTKYDGQILWIGESDLGQIDNYLKNGKRVFMTTESVTAPYRLIVGNNYHTTSLDNIGNSDAQSLFTKYEFDNFGDNLELKLNSSGKISPDAGKPVAIYRTDFNSRLLRNRIDYGDAGAWIWNSIINHRDPNAWTYNDVRGQASF